MGSIDQAKPYAALIYVGRVRQVVIARKQTSCKLHKCVIPNLLTVFSNIPTPEAASQRRTTSSTPAIPIPKQKKRKRRLGRHVADATSLVEVSSELDTACSQEASGVLVEDITAHDFEVIG